MKDHLDSQSKFWLNQAITKITGKYTDEKIIVSSGISPSADYHIGHFREILTAEAICWGLRRAGRQAEHIHVIDDFDPLRRRYNFLPSDYDKYIGWPLFKVPDPEGDCHTSYSEHFFSHFETYASQMGVVPTKIVRNSELYLSGQMAAAIEQTLANIDKVREILLSLSNRQLGVDWTPMQVIDASGKFEQGSLNSWNKKARIINGVDYTQGRVKMNWRLEWPARWRALGVMVEPFSHQEHGAAGGSYDTGVRIAREVLGFEPPLPGVQYGNIHIKGDTKKMSSSKGNLYTPAQVLEVMPPEILRYFVIKSRPEKQLDFDLYRGLYNLLEEYSKVEEVLSRGEESESAGALEFAKSLEGDKVQRTISGVPFNHLVFSYQAARGDKERVFDILGRSGFEDVVQKDEAVLKVELDYVARWLNKYAPAEIKFELLADCPELEISDEQLKFLHGLVEKLAGSEFKAQVIHDIIYQTAADVGFKPAEAFGLLYQLFLGQQRGPKLGFFLSSLERDFVIERLKLAH